MRRLASLVLLLGLLTGCASIPFPETPPYPMTAKDPAQVVADFRARTPDRLQMMNSLVFEIAGREVLAVGFLELSLADESFRVVCLNPMGVKLFDLAGTGSKTTLNYALEPLAKFPGLASAVAFDIKRIYFYMFPAADAVPRKSENRIIFGKALPDGYIEHVFAGERGDLVETRFYQDQVISWTVGYYEYRDSDGKRHPRGIILTDYRGGYRLIVREKEQDAEADQE